jgi:hypothetical protein
VEVDAPAGVRGQVEEAVTERDITGNASGSAYRRAQKIAENAELTSAELRTIAEGVREFDAQRTPEQRTAAALERIASKVGPEKNSEAYEQARLRRREVYAQELLAVAMLAEDVHDEHLVQIRQSNAYKNLVSRLAGRDATA